jgi:hypothetical protein
MTINVTPIPRLTVLAAPAFTLGTANAAGSALTAVASDSTLLTFDSVLPDAITYGQTGAAGSGTIASYRNHAHAMAATENDLVLIGTVVASDSATITITGLDSTYDSYLLAGSALVLANDAVGFDMRFGDASGIDSGSSDYSYMTANSSSSATDGGLSVSTGAPYIALDTRGAGNAAGEGTGFSLCLVQPGDSGQFNKVTGTFVYDTHDGAVGGGSIVGRRNSAITLTQVQLLGRTGNITSGRFTVWGYKHG